MNIPELRQFKKMFSKVLAITFMRLRGLYCCNLENIGSRRPWKFRWKHKFTFFMPSVEPIHIGHLIQETLESQGRSVAWLARQLNYTRENMYNIFKKQWIDTETLMKISLALDRNFFLLYLDFYEKCKENFTEVWNCNYAIVTAIEKYLIFLCNA